MAFVTIAGFSLPNYERGYAMKFERLFLLVATQIFDLWGFLGGLILLIAGMLFVKTLSGRNYLYPLVPFRKKGFAELFVRYPMK